MITSVHEHDLIWLHDYQLMLLPAVLKVAAPDLRVAFFLHTPFLFRKQDTGLNLNSEIENSSSCSSASSPSKSPMISQSA
jgi:hypothetical protein